MPISQYTLTGIRSEIRLQPFDLITAGGNIDLGIQGIDTPAAQAVNIIRWNIIEILEVSRRTGCVIFMIAGDGFDPVLKAPPGRIITVLKLIRCTVIIGVVTNSEYGTWDVLQQLRSQFIAVAVT